MLLYFFSLRMHFPFLCILSAEQPSKQILLKPTANTAVVQGSVTHTALYSSFSLTRLTTTCGSKNRKFLSYLPT